MQVTGGYSALGNICEIASGQCLRRLSLRRGRSSGDTVSISAEALAAYRNSYQQDTARADEAMPDRAAKFRQALEEAWDDGASGTAPSLLGKLRAALSSWKTEPQNGDAVQPKMAGLHDDALAATPKAGTGASERFRKQFAPYRGDGIFTEQAGSSPDASVDNAVAPDGAK